MSFTKTFILLFATLAFELSGVAQEPKVSPANPSQVVEPTSQATKNAKPVNLKALSQDISAESIRSVMHGYSQALGVSCGYCHEENAQTGKLDFASDGNPMKQTARLMIHMTTDINGKYLAQLGDRRYAEPLTCAHCHQGHASPPTFEPKP